MDAVFTTTYPEHEVAVELSNYLKKKDGFSITIPLSRQQKGFDLLVYSLNRRKAATIQIKSSRSYRQRPPKRTRRNSCYHYALWFKNFEWRRAQADFYVLFGLYAHRLKDNLKRARTTRKWWAHRLFLFSDKEMGEFLNRLSTTKSGKRARFFSVHFNDDSRDAYLVRGATGDRPESMTEFSLDQRHALIRGFLVHSIS